MNKPRYPEKIKESRDRLSIYFYFSSMVFVMLLVAVILSVAVLYVLFYFGVEIFPEIVPMFFFVLGISIVLGTGIALLTIKFPIKAVSRVVAQINRLASGDYKTRLDVGEPLNSHPAFKNIKLSFDKMAQELEQTEMLRNDFINNFSHEFKTPIVSIAGFAKLLKRGDLTEEQRQEYISIIEEESLRLSYMATNMLNLTRVENQSILTDIVCYNLSEQLRSSVLLLEDKWTRRELDIEIDFDEFYVYANEEMLKQVWINLLDNAIKFSPTGGAVRLSVERRGEGVLVSVVNEGDIPPESRPKIFNKFYQADESHTEEGNGIGLSVVKKIVELHEGGVELRCEDGLVIFDVYLPAAKRA